MGNIILTKQRATRVHKMALETTKVRYPALKFHQL